MVLSDMDGMSSSAFWTARNWSYQFDEKKSMRVAVVFNR